MSVYIPVIRTDIPAQSVQWIPGNIVQHLGKKGNIPIQIT